MACYKWHILLLWLAHCCVSGHPGVAATADAVGGDIDDLFKDEGFLRMSRSGESFGSNRPPPPPLIDMKPSEEPLPPNQPLEVIQGPRKGERSSNDAATSNTNNGNVMPSVSYLDLAFGLDRSPLEKNIAAVFSKVSFANTGQNATKTKEDNSVSGTSTTSSPTTRVMVTATVLTPTSTVKPSTTQVTYAAPGSGSIDPQQPLIRPPFKDTPTQTNDTEYDFVPILQNPTVTRILAGSTGKRPPPTLFQLPEDLQRRLRENLTSFLNEVNKDSMIDVKPPLPTYTPAPEHPTPSQKPPPVYTMYPKVPVTQQLPTEDPDTLPPSPSENSIRVMIGGVTSDEPVVPDIIQIDTNDERITTTPVTLAIAWDVHVYLMGILFALLALYSLVSLVRLHGCTHLLPKGYFLTLNTLMLVLGTLRSLFLFYDAYNLHRSFPPVLAYLFLHIAFPCLTSAFGVLFLALLRATQMQVNALSPRIQRPGTLVTIVIVHFVITIAAAIAVGCEPNFYWLILVAQTFNLVWAIALAVAYFCAFSSMYRTALRQQGEVIRATFTKMHIEGAALPKRLPRPTLGRAYRVAFAVALLAVLLAILQLAGVFGIYGVTGLSGMVGDPRPSPWPWWGFLLSERVTEVVIGGLIAYLSTRPIRCADTEQGGVALGGTPRLGQNAPSNVNNTSDRTAVFALFGCGPHLGCGPGLCRCSMSQPSEEGKTPTANGEDMYPTICATNQAVRNYSLTSGKSVYDNTYLSQGPTVAMGDKLVPIASLAKRRPVKKTGTLLSTLSDGRATLPAACHQGSPVTSTSGCHSNTSSINSRTSSMLFSEKGFVRFRGLGDPEQPMEEVLQTCSSSRRLSDTIDDELYQNLPMTIATAARQMEQRGRRGLYAASLDATDTSSGDALSYYPVSTTARAKCASTCSSESAANSFDVRLYPHGNGMPLFRTEDIHMLRAANRTAGNSFRRAGDHQLYHTRWKEERSSNREKNCQVVAPPPPPYRSMSPLPTDFTSRSDLNIDFLTDASTSHLSNEEHFSDSDVASSVEPSGYEDNADDEQESDPGGLEPPPPQFPVPPPCNVLNLNLPIIRSTTTSQDVTPDSAVVADISDSSSKNEVALGSRVGGVLFHKESEGHRPVSVPSRDIPTLPVTRSPGVLRISASSLNDVLNGCGKGILSKLKGSNFSLNGYSPLGSDDMLHQHPELQRLLLEAGRPLELNIQCAENQRKPLLSSPLSQPMSWDVHTSPLVSPSYYQTHQPCFSCSRTDIRKDGGAECWTDSSCDQTFMPVPRLNDLSIETHAYKSDDMNITPDLYPIPCGYRYDDRTGEHFYEEESVV